ncbi:hypothetical protein LTR62_000962 [Meristemomyces frigidus]|uniref:Uncharacterized protein n=1 Tax=Meristemomyces frigidus TaxID=1508187 RepID=A0AAN7YBW0_9PEZI|nr:hypothetical protein LTR62_000962 [Meristemomyces frigidus]
MQVYNEPIDDTTHPEPKFKRYRSILKNSTPLIPDSTTQPSQTEADTRRNSMVAVEIQESHYFTNAIGVFESPDPATRSAVPRRKSGHGYFDDIQVLYSEAVVLETSQSDHVHGEPAMELFREDMCSSQTVPRPSRSLDLRALTRTVSREHGTVSQPVRRKSSSLAFRSPLEMPEIR